MNKSDDTIHKGRIEHVKLNDDVWMGKQSCRHEIIIFICFTCKIPIYTTQKTEHLQLQTLDFI